MSPSPPERRAERLPTTRTFVAVLLPPHVKSAIATRARALGGALPPPPRGLRWVTTDQVHLTLAFLGDVDRAEVPAIQSASRTAAAATRPFEADLRGLGAFPQAGRAQVAWIGWGVGTEAVTALQATLVDALDRGPDRRAFSPHVTIARAREPLDLRAWLATAPAWSSPGWRVDAIHVMASQPSREGVLHTIVERCPFADRG